MVPAIAVAAVAMVAAGYAAGSERKLALAHDDGDGRRQRTPPSPARRSARQSQPARTPSSSSPARSATARRAKAASRRTSRRSRRSAKRSTVAQLTQIINHGLGESANPRSRTCRSGARCSRQTQVGDLVSTTARACLPSPRTTRPSRRTGRRRCRRRAVRPLRVRQLPGPERPRRRPNPLSPDKSIPPLSGGDFRNEFNTDAKIADMIRSGSVIGRAPIVNMPHWVASSRTPTSRPSSRTSRPSSSRVDSQGCPRRR